MKTANNDIFDVYSIKNRNRQAKVYWNIPTFQCDSQKLNFTRLAEKYAIVHNANDMFRGDKITILYDPGSFPAILKDGSKTFLRNGGVPQKGNLTKHLEIFRALLKELIPDENFSGIGIIDFESWRPIFRQNFGVLSEYKNLSISIEKRRHPFWPSVWIEKEATNRFETFAKKFMEQTLSAARIIRPNATWGYYAYPYCFNMSPNNMQQKCPKEVIEENNRIQWLFLNDDNFYPSIYLPNLRLTENEKVQMIQGRIEESRRIKKQFNRTSKIIPYFWYKYQDTNKFVTKTDLSNAFGVLSKSDIDGLVIWGSSNDVNSKQKCLDLYHYIDNTLGPLLVNSF
nr:hyaluronidase-like [Leptinotarsa decemlineata]